MTPRDTIPFRAVLRGVHITATIGWLTYLAWWGVAPAIAAEGAGNGSPTKVETNHGPPKLRRNHS